MQPYQDRYVENIRKITSLGDFYSVQADSFGDWYAQQKERQAAIEELRRENIALLSEHLFPMLDGLHTATAEDIAELEEFADKLMDWSTNLDCGVYVLIHDSLLSLYRFRKDRNRIIKELYKLGMGLYYQSRMVSAVELYRISAFRFDTEMVFTEAASYFKFFADLGDEETQGYVLRCLANIAICTTDLKRRIATSARVLKIIRDDYYRSLAPGLPWDTFLRRTNQQMSSNRAILSDGNLSKEELSAVLESCHDVYTPEAENKNPNIRWLWPYYEMEYSCGFVDLSTTLDRLEYLIEGQRYDQYDISGLYANVQLAVYYGRLMELNPALHNKPRHTRFLNQAYRKMMKTLLTFPVEKFDDLFYYNVRLVVTDYFETEGVESYRDVTTRLMRRVAGLLYIRSLQAGDILKLYCAAIFDSDPAFFDDIDFLRAIEEPEEKRRALLDYAENCGLYHNFGLLKMNAERLSQTRNLFEREDRMVQVHAASGHDDLLKRKSTAMFADVAYGHHRWYNGAGGYPEDYVRSKSPYRQMTDVMAVVSCLMERFNGDLSSVVREIVSQERTRFSPLVTPFLLDEGLQKGIEEILLRSDERYYRPIYDEITAGNGM